MAITQLNPETGQFNYSKMLETLNESYKTQADITLSNYDNDAAPQVQAGSIFANTGALFANDSDVTPTGYGAISNSTLFYLYYDADSTETFIYSETVPTWDDDKQGWYNGNNRAFFSLYKDSGGTLYKNKQSLLEFNDVKALNSLHGQLAQSVKFSALEPFLPNIGDEIAINGGVESGGGMGATSKAIRTATTVITYYYINSSGTFTGTWNSASGVAGYVSITWDGRQ